MPTKPHLRENFRARRDALPPATIQSESAAIHRSVIELPEIRNARTVFAYAATPHEVQTDALIDELLLQGKTVALPRITDPDTRQMQAVVIRSRQDLAPGPHGIPTPVGHEILSPPFDATLLPGLAFCPTTGDRLGMGGGYYDRFITTDAAFPFRVGLAFNQQLAASLPTEPHDHSVHAVVTPTTTYRITIPR